MDVSPQSLSIEGDEARAFYQRTVDVFGGDSVTILFFKDPELFTSERLRAIHGLIAELEALPYVTGTKSLFSLPNLHTDEEGYVRTDAHLSAIPETTAQVATVRTAALKNPFVQDSPRAVADAGRGGICDGYSLIPVNALPPPRCWYRTTPPNPDGMDRRSKRGSYCFASPKAGCC